MYIYIYIYICVCVCVCVFIYMNVKWIMANVSRVQYPDLVRA